MLVTYIHTQRGKSFERGFERRRMLCFEKLLRGFLVFPLLFVVVSFAEREGEKERKEGGKRRKGVQRGNWCVQCTY